MNVHVFETSVRKINDALNLENLLALYFKVVNVNFDTFDYSDGKRMVLRIEAPRLEPVRVVNTMNEFGFDCREL